MQALLVVKAAADFKKDRRFIACIALPYIQKFKDDRNAITPTALTLVSESLRGFVTTVCQSREMLNVA